MNHWAVLQIAPTHDVKAIKSAYAVLLKLHKPEQDPVGYQRLREAFDDALAEAKKRVKTLAAMEETAHVSNAARAKGADQTSQDVDPVVSPIIAKGREEPDSRPGADVSRHARSRFRNPQENFLDLQSAPPWNIDDPVIQVLSAVEDERAVEKQVLQIVSEMDSILHRDGDQAACKYLKVILDADEFGRLDRRAQLDSALWKWATRWQQRYVPLFLFEYLFEEFAWTQERNSAEDAESLRYLQDRMESARAYIKLRDLSVRSASRGDNQTRREIRVAKLLLGEFNEKAFRRAIFTNTDFRSVRKTLRALQRSTPTIFQYELDSPTVHWFLKRLGKTYFTATHLKVSAIACAGLGLTQFSHWQAVATTWPWSAVTVCAVLGWLLVAMLAWGLQHLAMTAARLGYRQIKLAYPVLHRHYVQISDQVNEHTWAHNGMFALAWGLVATSATRTGWESALLLLFALPVSVVLWNELFVAVAFNALLVAITMSLCDEGAALVVPGNRLEHVILLTLLSSRLLYWILELVPERMADYITDKLLRMMLLFVAFDAMVVALFYQLNDRLAS